MIRSILRGYFRSTCGFCSAPIKMTLGEVLRGRPWVCGTAECIIAFHGPPDPLTYEPEPEPEDWWICSHCQGWGEYQARQDWETGMIETEKCLPCKGTGFYEGKRWLVAEAS